MTERINHLVAVLVSYAPNPEDATRYVHREKQFAQNDELVRILAGAIYDGLAYGNWPWTVKR